MRQGVTENALINSPLSESYDGDTGLSTNYSAKPLVSLIRTSKRNFSNMTKFHIMACLISVSTLNFTSPIYINTKKTFLRKLYNTLKYRYTFKTEPYLNSLNGTLLMTKKVKIWFL